ncbi:unnamed protein product [Amoebophrya sp. A25]|nr:unnamed protein product [Amoebophrya sp. A25]|eukprot:GSA25T00014187001.1
MDVNLRDSYGRTPLHVAAETGALRAAENLLSRTTCLVDARCHMRRATPLLIACATRCSPAMVELLLHKGADPRAKMPFVWNWHAVKRVLTYAAMVKRQDLLARAEKEEMDEDVKEWLLADWTEKTKAVYDFAARLHPTVRRIRKFLTEAGLSCGDSVDDIERGRRGSLPLVDCLESARVAIRMQNAALLEPLNNGHANVNTQDEATQFICAYREALDDVEDAVKCFSLVESTLQSHPRLAPPKPPKPETKNTTSSGGGFFCCASGRSKPARAVKAPAPAAPPEPKNELAQLVKAI